MDLEAIGALVGICVLTVITVSAGVVLMACLVSIHKQKWTGQKW